MCMDCISCILATETRKALTFPILTSPRLLGPPYLFQPSLSDTIYALIILVIASKLLITWY